MGVTLGRARSLGRGGPRSDFKHRQADLEELGRFVEAGQVTPMVDRVYPLAEVPNAIRHDRLRHG